MASISHTDALNLLRSLRSSTVDVVFTEMPIHTDRDAWGDKMRSEFSKEVQRILRPGGICWFTAHTHSFLWRWVTALSSHHFGKLKVAFGANYLTRGRSLLFIKLQKENAGEQRKRETGFVWADDYSTNLVSCEAGNKSQEFRANWLAAPKLDQDLIVSPGNPQPLDIDFIRALLKREELNLGRKGAVVDPFCGSGTTAVAAILEGWDYHLAETKAERHKAAKKNQELWEQLAPNVAPLEIVKLEQVQGDLRSGRGVKTLAIPNTIRHAVSLGSFDLSATIRAALKVWLREAPTEAKAAPPGWASSMVSVFDTRDRKTTQERITFSRVQEELLNAWADRGYNIEHTVTIALASYLLGDFATHKDVAGAIPYGGLQ